jgi:predicted MFS family arabinose efflux permease
MPLLLVLGLASFVGALSSRIVDPVVPAIARDLGTTMATAALLTSAFTFPYAFGQPILGPLSDSIGKALIIKIGLAVLAVTLAASAVAPTIGTLFGARILGGIAAGGIIPLALALVGDRFSIADRQFALSRILTAALIGQLVGVIGSGLVATSFGWRSVMALSCLASLAALFVTLRSLQAGPAAKMPRLTIAAIRAGYERVFQNPNAAVCYSAVFVEAVSLFGLLPYVATLLEQKGAGGVREAGFVIAGMGIGGLLFTFTVRTLLLWLRGQMNLIRAGGLVAAVGLVAVAAAPTWPLEMAAFIVIGCGFYMVHNSLQTQATELAPDNRGAAVALHAFFFFLGQAAGPIVFALGLATAGPAPTILIAALTMALLGFAVAEAMQRIMARAN